MGPYEMEKQKLKEKEWIIILDNHIDGTSQPKILAYSMLVSWLKKK